MTESQQGKQKIDLDAELTKLIGYYDEFCDELSEALDEAKTWRKYYDGQQWTSSEEAELAKRGQPITTINLVAKKLNYVLGAEVDDRTDPVAYPRTPMHEDDAQAITDALRYVTESERFNQTKSKVAKDQLVTGFGACVIEVERTGRATSSTEAPAQGALTSTRGQDEIRIKYRRVPWDRFWWDPHSRDEMFDDAKYKGLVVWMDQDDAIDAYPQAKSVVESAINEGIDTTGLHDDVPTSAWADATRQRVKVCECYYRRNGTWHVAHFTKSGFLVEPRVVAYVDEDGVPCCPLVATSGYVRDDDGARYGLVMNMVSPQDEINKRRSKALHALSTRQVVLERGAVNDIEETRTQVARPDGVIEVNPGFLTQGGFSIQSNTELAAGQVQLLSESKNEMIMVGVDGQVGDVSTGTSGRALLARQQMANRELKSPFDNLRTFTLNCYEQTWWRIRQFWTSEIWLRVRDADELKGYRFVGLNKSQTKAQRLQEMIQGGVDPQVAVQSLQVSPQVLQEIMGRVQQELMAAQQQGVQVSQEQVQQYAMQLASRHPALQEMVKSADVSQLNVDIIVETTPDTAIIEQEEFETLTQITPSITAARPDLAPKLMELIVRASQLRSKREILEALKPAQPDPEAQQKQQQAEAAQQKQLALALQQMQADVQKTQAQTQQAQATAAKTAAETQAVGPKAKLAEAQATKHAVEAGLALGEAQTPEPELAVVIGKPRGGGID